MGGELEDLWWRTSQVQTGQQPGPSHAGRSVWGRRGHRERPGPGDGHIKVVETATGYVDQMLVLVPDDKGRFHVALGGVYSYYEFHQPVSDRLTDEAWHSMLASGDVPARPDWIGPTMR